MDDFADLHPKPGKPAHALRRLALVTLMQFHEGLSDRQVARALDAAREDGLKARERQHMDSAHVLAAIRTLNRVERVAVQWLTSPCTATGLQRLMPPRPLAEIGASIKGWQSRRR